MALTLLQCYLDRTNLAFASMQLTKDLNFTAETYGLGAGLFYLGKPELCSIGFSHDAPRCQVRCRGNRRSPESLTDVTSSAGSYNAKKGHHSDSENGACARDAGYSLSMIPSQLILMKLGANVWLGTIGEDLSTPSSQGH